MNTRTGRPPLEDPRSEQLAARLTKSEYAEIVEAALADDQPRPSVWARERLLEAARSRRHPDNA